MQQIADVEVIPFRRLHSPAISSTDWLELRQLVDRVLSNEGVDGAVIAHGTNTLEETAYFLDLALHTQKPVVFVGAMRPASALSSDGDLNLVNAVRVAAAPESAGQGVLVVLNDAIHAAR